jgi:hypothetical protein
MKNYLATSSSTTSMLLGLGYDVRISFKYKQGSTSLVKATGKTQGVGLILLIQD